MPRLGPRGVLLVCCLLTLLVGVVAALATWGRYEAWLRCEADAPIAECEEPGRASSSGVSAVSPDRDGTGVPARPTGGCTTDCLAKGLGSDVPAPARPVRLADGDAPGPRGKRRAARRLPTRGRGTTLAGALDVARQAAVELVVPLPLRLVALLGALLMPATERTADAAAASWRSLGRAGVDLLVQATAIVLPAGGRALDILGVAACLILGDRYARRER